MKTPTRIFLVDDHEVVRRGVRALLETQRGFEICGESDNGRTAIELVAQLRPDVLIMDISLPGLNGLEATRRIVAGGFCREVLILTMYDNEPLIRDALSAGAHGFVLKSDAGCELIAAINALRKQKPFFASRPAALAHRAFLAQQVRPRLRRRRRGELTPREQEVLQLLAEGRSNRQVGTLLGISVKTAETHRARVMRKLAAGSVADLVRYAIRNHIIEA
jgi:DNA-binding NarL/FixJ family response regulator